MKKLFILLLLLPVLNISAQEKSLKDQALESFDKGHYDKSINLLNEALKRTKNDPEIYCYLGMATHYKAYSNQGEGKYDYTKSEQVFNYLNKAIELDSTYGDARYFYGAECSVNALKAMEDRNLEKMKFFYEKAYDKGAYPSWLIDFGYNMLMSCDRNAILFTGGSADFDVCSYLQLHRDFRTDVTIIPITDIGRPWYIKFLKDGLEGGVKPITINMTDEEIQNLRPVKWKDTELSLYYDRAYQRGLRLPSGHKMKWLVEADLDSNKKYVASESNSKRVYLSAQRAMLLKIIEDNYGDRKIFFSNACEPYLLAGLFKYTRNRGLVGELMPIETAGTTILNDYEEMAKLLTKANLRNYRKLKDSDIPRVSGILYLYHNSLVTLAGYYRLIKDEAELKTLLKTYSECLRGVNEEDDEYYPSVLKIKYKKK